jgi:hypothetical protein
MKVDLQDDLTHRGLTTSCISEGTMIESVVRKTCLLDRLKVREEAEASKLARRTDPISP